MYSQKTKTGKVRFFESYVDPLTRIRKTASVTLDKDTTKSRKRAQALLQARIDSLTGEAGKPSTMTLEGLIEAYTAAQAGLLREQTLAHNTCVMRKCAEMFPGIKIDMLNARIVTTAFSALDAPASKKNGRIRHLRTLLRWAYKMDYLADVSWLDKLPIYPDDVKARRDLKYLEPEELKAVLDAADKEYKILIEFLALSGLRIGEAIALTPDDITDVIRVNKTYSTTTKEVGPVKTAESLRDVYIQKELRDVIDQCNKKGPALLTKAGRQTDYFAFNTYFGDLTERITGRRLTAHALRHTHVSLLAAKGVPLSLISRRLGHRDSKITSEIYFHVTEALRDKDAALLDSITLL